MTFKLPTTKQLVESGEELGMDLSESYAAEIRDYIRPFVDAYNLIGTLPDYLPEVKYPRTPGYRPEGAENEFGAWYVKTTITGAKRGKLAGKTVAIKDATCVAGVPMMNGASLLEGYVPEIDATVVTRLLDAGATILGKSVCEYFSYAGGSLTSANGPVISPRNPDHTPGGSSTGAAALVAAGEVDIATGGDQAGSIRIPASHTGVVGIKPTYGLVPYTGIMAIEATIDHTGPLTADVATSALALEVLAGDDGLDTRQRNVKTARYRDALDKGVKGLRIGVVKEAFGNPDSEAGVDRTVRAAAKQMQALGAEVEEVSIPWHHFGVPIWAPVTLEGSYHLMLVNNGDAKNTGGVHQTSLIKALSNWPNRANELPHTLTVAMLLAHHSDKNYHGIYYAKAQNLRRRLRADFDAALATYDLLLSPTTAMTTQRIPDPDVPLPEYLEHCWRNISNTCQFNMTGHPAISVPCGLSDGKPVGLQLVGKHWDELTLYRAAHAYEQSGDWQKNGAAKSKGRKSKK
jgi:amidase